MSRILRHVGNKDFKRTRQRQVDEQRYIAAKKLKELQEAEEERRQVEEIARPYKSNWREETQLQENDWTPVAGSIANSTAQTFEYGGFGGPQATFSGLGGVEAVPSTVTIDYGFGETEVVSPPTFSQLGMQGYAPPLANIQRKTDQEEDERIDAEIRKLQEQIKQLDQKISNLSAEQAASEPEYTGMTYDQYYDRKKEIGKKWTEKTSHLGQIMMRSNSASEVNAARDKYYEYNDARVEELDALDAEYKSQSDSHTKKIKDHYNAYSKKFDPLRKEQNTLNAKIAELEKQRPINQQLDASQQAYPNLPFMGARVQSAAGQPSFNYDPAKTPFGADYGEVSQVIDGEELLPQRIQDILKKGRNRAARKGINTELLNNYEKPEVQDVLQQSPELHDMYLRHMIGGAGGGYVPGGGMIDPSAAANAGDAARRMFSDVINFAKSLPANVSQLAGQPSTPAPQRMRGQGGRSLGSTTQRQGGAINPSTSAPSATGISFSDLVSAANQVRQDNLARNGEAPINPNIIGRLARSATDNIRYAPGGQMITGLPTGRTYDPNFRSNMKLQRVVPGRIYGTPLQTMSPGEINVGRMYQDTNQLTRGTPFGKKAGGYFAQPAPKKGMRGIKNPFGSVVNRGWSGTPEIQIPKGGPQAVRASADDLARAATKSSTKASRVLSRLIPGANAILAGADVAQRSSQGDYFGAALGAATAIPGPAGWAALAAQLGYDALGRPFKASPSTVTPTSGRGAGRSSFPTSDGNVVPRSNSANANSVGQRGSDGGMTDSQIKAAQDRANAARRAGKMSDIRGSQANKGFAPDPKTGEPRYTGLNDQQYSDAYNKIADKYNNLRAPIERQYAEFSGQQAPASLMNKLNALNDAQTAEEDALRAARAAQENAFNDALQDYNDKQDAANQAKQDALDEIDNEEDPYSKLLAELGAKLEKLRREGRLIARYKILGPGDKGYVDTTKMANSIGYNRVPIYTAAAKELQKQIDAAQESQMAWMNDRDKRREDAEKADYSDAGGSSGQGRRKGGQGGLPLGTTSLRSGGARQGVAPENKSQSAALARQAASARMNRQQKRRRGIKESTWDRIKKYR